MARKKADRVMQVTQRINTSLWLEETFDEDLPSCIEQLEQVPARVSQWKKSSARCGAGFALVLVKTHCNKIKDLEILGDGNPPGKDCTDHLPVYLEAASKIAAFIDLDTFVDATEVPDSPEETAGDAEEENE